MTMNIDMQWFSDEYGYGKWEETVSRLMLTASSTTVACEECDFNVNGVRYNVRFNYNDPEKSRVIVY